MRKFSQSNALISGLQAIHQAGWVHRDISSGNILMVDGVAKIADFEYAKKMSDISHHTLRTVRLVISYAL